jgi:hypothetical protein
MSLLIFWSAKRVTAPRRMVLNAVNQLVSVGTSGDV